MNVGSRLCSLAREGQVCYSAETRRACADQPPGESTGTVQLKGVALPVEVFVLEQRLFDPAGSGA